MSEWFEDMLTGGHPNSLGRTIEVVDMVLANPDRFEELFRCYQSADEVVRLRTSNAMKRVEKEKHALLVPYIDQFIEEIGKLDQASAQWTLAQLFEVLTKDMDDAQIERAKVIVKRNLSNHEDWIVLKTSAKTLTLWAKNDDDLRAWLEPHLKRLAVDERKTVSGQAKKSLKALGFE